MKLTAYCLLFAFLLASCSNNHKKILVLTKGSTKVDKETKIVTVGTGTGGDSKLLEYDDAKVTFTIKKGDGGDVAVDFTEPGYYILNAKVDTVVGSLQHYGESGTKVLKQEVLKKALDSLTLLLQNKNVSDANKNFFIAPYTSVKVTTNGEAIVVPPYRQLPSIEVKDDKQPEVYRFWNINEIRETMDRLAKDTVAIKK
jgi:hypothetical protein